MKAPSQPSNPKFSIIIPTYGRSKHILPTIQSVLIQNFESFELLIIGDGVDDDTFEYCKNLDPRIQIHNLEKNSGSQSLPNNFGCQIAKGEYIAYLGHDDIWMPNHLGSLNEVFENTLCDVAVSGCIIYGPQGTNLEQVTGIFDNSQDAFTHFFPPSSFAHKKSVIDQVGKWGNPKALKVTVDTDFLLRLVNQGFQFASTKIITVHKFHAGSRYLSYLFCSSDEQRAVLEKIKQKKLSSESFKDIVEKAILKNRFMNITYQDSSQLSPGYLYKYFRDQKGLEAIDIKKLENLEYVPVDSSSHPLGLDWYVPEFNNENKTFFRWSGPSLRPKIMIPFASDQLVYITLHLLDPFILLNEMVIELNHTSIEFSEFINQDGWHELSFIAPLKDNYFSVLELILSKSFCPAEINGSLDQRNLGIIYKGYTVQSLKRKVAQIPLLENQIVYSNDERDQAVSMLSAARAELEVIHNERNQAIAIYRDSRAELEVVKNERDQLTSMLSAAETKLEVVIFEKKAFLKSNSWKITKPLRYIKNYFLRLRIYLGF